MFRVSHRARLSRPSRSNSGSGVIIAGLTKEERPKRAKALPDSGAVPGEEFAVDEVDTAGRQGRDESLEGLEIREVARMEGGRVIGEGGGLGLEIRDLRQRDLGVALATGGKDVLPTACPEAVVDVRILINRHVRPAPDGTEDPQPPLP